MVLKKTLKKIFKEYRDNGVSIKYKLYKKYLSLQNKILRKIYNNTKQEFY